MLAALVWRSGQLAATTAVFLLLGIVAIVSWGSLPSRQGRQQEESQSLPVTLLPAYRHAVGRQAILADADEALDETCAARGIADQEVVAVVENNSLPLGMTIATMLTKDTLWYEDTLEDLLVEYCEETRPNAHSRYVTSDNITAAKDDQGNCVQVSDGDGDAYAAGLCETTGNCYWEEPREGQTRNRRYTDEQYAAEEDAARDYMEDIVLNYGTLGFVLAAAVFVGCVRFFILRGVYNKCVCDGDLQRERVGYTATEQKAPATVFVVGLAVVVVAGLLGSQGNSSVSDGLDVMFETMDGASDDMRELVSSVSSPLGSFVDTLDNSTGEMQLLLAATDEWLGELEAGLALRLDAFDSAHRHRFQGRGAEFDTLAAGVEDAGASFVSDVVDTISAALDVVQEEFLDARDVMEGQSGNVLAALAIVNDTAAGTGAMLTYFRRMSDEYVGVRHAGVLAMFASVAVCGAAGMVGITAGLTNIKPCAPCINFLGLTCVVAATATWMAFALSSLLIVGTVAWSDGCHFLALAARRGWETAGIDGQSAAVLDGCFRGRSVADEFNLTEALGFFDSYAVIADEVEALNATASRSSAETEAAISTLSDFVDSLNSTDVAVSLLDFYTNYNNNNAEVNGSAILLEPECPYNVSFDGEATEYLGRPWLALPTVDSSAAAVVADDDDNGDNGSTTTTATNETALDPQTPWEAGGTRQSFGRQGGESASAYMSRVFNSSECSSLNDDLLSAWDFASRERAVRDQMNDDLTCVISVSEDEEATDCPTTNTTSQANVSSSTTSTLSSASSSPVASTSLSSSSTFSLSPCSACTSDNYTESDSLLAHFKTFTDNITDLRGDLANLLNRSYTPSMTTSTITSAVVAGPLSGSLADASAAALSARCASRCSFLRARYESFEGAMCADVLTGLAQLGFSMFLLGLGGLALAVTAGIMVHRLKAAWATDMAKVLSTEECVVMEEY